MQKQEIGLEVESRSETGTNCNRRLRSRGMVPAVVYGLDRPSFLVAVDGRRVDELLRLGSGRNTILTLKLADQDRSRAAMIKDLQRDPVTENVVHIDFVRIDLDTAVQVTVPVSLIGIADGVKNDGGIMDFIQRDIRVECLPSDIPDHLDVNVEALHVGQHVSVSDLEVGDRVTVLDDPNSIISVVMAKRAEEETVAEGEVEVEAPVAEGEAEPEVIKKGKDASEGEEGADKSGD